MNNTGLLWRLSETERDVISASGSKPGQTEISFIWQSHMSAGTKEVNTVSVMSTKMAATANSWQSNYTRLSKHEQQSAGHKHTGQGSRMEKNAGEKVIRKKPSFVSPEEIHENYFSLQYRPILGYQA